MAEEGTKPPGTPQPGHGPSDVELTRIRLLNTVVDGIAQSADSIGKAFAALDISKIAEAAKHIETATAGWTSNLKGASEELYSAFRTITATAESFNKLRESGEATNQLRRIAAEMDREAKLMRDSEKEDLIKVTSIWEDLVKKHKEFIQAQAATPVGMGALKGAKSVDDASRSLMHIEDLPGKLMKLIPGGGLIELMFMGMNKHEEWRAKSEMVVQQFDSMGGGAEKYGSAIAENIETMEQWNTHAVQDFISVANALKSGSITADQALGKEGMGSSLSKLGTSVEDVTLKFDYMMEVAAGTGAKMVATGYREFGNTLKDSAEFIVNYGLAAQNAGQETMQFLGSVMQTAESLKLYHVQLSTVADQSLKLIDINKSRGMSAAYAGVVSQAGQQQAFQGIQNMQDGYAAFIGARVVQHLSAAGRGNIDKVMGPGASSDPVSILMEMKRGFRDLGNDPSSKSALGTMVSEIAKQAQEAAGPKRGQQEFYLERMGFGVEGGRAILDMASSVASGKVISDKQLETLKGATISQQQQMNQLTVAMNKAAQGIADIATGLMGVILSGIKAIIGLLVAVVAKLMDPLGTLPEGVTKFIESAFEGMKSSGSMMGQGIGKLRDAAGTAGGVGPLGDFTRGWDELINRKETTKTPPPIDEERVAELARRTATAAGGRADAYAMAASAAHEKYTPGAYGLPSTSTGFGSPVSTSGSPNKTKIRFMKTKAGYQIESTQEVVMSVDVPFSTPRSEGATGRKGN